MVFMQARVTNQMAAYLVLLIIIIFHGTAYSDVIRVTTIGNDANSGATWALAKKTVASAINAAMPVMKFGWRLALTLNS